MTSTKQQQKHALMTETPIPRLIIRLAIPAIISMLITQPIADVFSFPLALILMRKTMQEIGRPETP